MTVPAEASGTLDGDVCLPLPRPPHVDTSRRGPRVVSPGEVTAEAGRRRTIAVISHPDAGKSTLTEALLLHARAIGRAGAVHGKAGRQGTVSDWMDIEKSPWTDEKSPIAIEPGKRNRWTLSPVIVFKDGKPFIAIGGAGAETTAQGIVQPILNVIEFGMDMQTAVDSPRFRFGDVYHYTGGTDIWLDRSWKHLVLSDDVVKGLAAKGHKIVPVETAGLNPLSGHTNAVLIDQSTGAYISGAHSKPGARDWVMGW